MSFKHSPLILALAAAFSAATPAQAVEVGGMELMGSGFLTLAVGKMLGGSEGIASDLRRPIFVSDYGQGGIYDGRGGLQWKPDTKLGLQGTAIMPNRDLSFTGQIVARGARDGEVNLEWLYASYRINQNFTLQAGRKRLPMFYFSDTQDVGFALPWTHLPSQLYGWEAVNYNGVNLRYQGQWGEWSSAINLLAGSESWKESGYWKVYLGKNNRTDIKWEKILGGDITLSKDWFEGRFVYIQSDMRQKNVSGTWNGSEVPGMGGYGSYTDPFDPDITTVGDSEFGPKSWQKIYGLAFNVDYENWLLRSEFIYIDHNKDLGYKDSAQILGVGYRWGKFTPMVTVANYRAIAVPGVTTQDAMEAHRTTSLTLRYDLTTSSALKLQYDSQKDRSGPNYTLIGSNPDNRFGDARLLTLSYDLVF